MVDMIKLSGWASKAAAGGGELPGNATSPNRRNLPHHNEVGHHIVGARLSSVGWDSSSSKTRVQMNDVDCLNERRFFQTLVMALSPSPFLLSPSPPRKKKTSGF